jgi:hypothetical protein
VSSPEILLSPSSTFRNSIRLCSLKVTCTILGGMCVVPDRPQTKIVLSGHGERLFLPSPHTSPLFMRTHSSPSVKLNYPLLFGRSGAKFHTLTTRSCNCLIHSLSALLANLLGVFSVYVCVCVCVCVC